MIILITGKIGSGKSTLAKILVDEYGFTEHIFAGPLKRFAVDIGFSPDQVYGTQEQKLEVNSIYNISGREFMQKFAGEVCRQYLPTILPTVSSIWVQAATPILEKGGNIVFSDCRFANEIAKAKEYGAIVIKIERETKYSSDHMSESGVDKLDYDHLIINNGTLDDLKCKLSKIMGVKKHKSIFVILAVLLLAYLFIYEFGFQ